MSTAVDRRPITFAGMPASSWAFAIRIWLAIVVALYISFWLELEAPSSAALTVTILALPTRGQVLEKAFFRLIATVLGVAASITIVGMFAQTEILLLGAFAAWLGICVYAVGLLDGNRAYAAALSGYTVGIIAVQQIDNPQHVFESAMARGAAIVVGVLAITIVNDLLAAPDQNPRLAAQLESLRLRVASYARRALHADVTPAVGAATLFREIVALRPEMASLAAELSSGPARSAAARSAMVGLVTELFAARALGELFHAALPALREPIVAARDAGSSGDDGISQHKAPPGKQGEPSRDLLASAVSWFGEYALGANRAVREDLEALAAGRTPPEVWRAPLYRSQRVAAEAGIRAAVYFLTAATFFAVGGWSANEVSLQFVVIIIGLGTTTADLRAFTTVALVAAPIASIMAGILEFVVLDGVTAFPLLALGLAPFLIGAALLMTVPNRIVSALGQLNLVFIVGLLAPSNPQTYNPQTFLFAVLFLLLATGFLFLAQIFLPPVSSAHRCHWLLASARHDVRHLPSRHKPNLAPEEAMLRDADRVAQILAASGDASEHHAVVEEAMTNFDQAATLRLCEVELERLPQGLLGAEVSAAYWALEKRDSGSIMASARAVHAASLQDLPVKGASAALVLASIVFALPRPGVVQAAERPS